MYKELLPECINFLRSPKAEKDEDYGIEFVVLTEDNDGRLTVAARGVSPAMDGNWEVYEIDEVEDLFWRVPEPGGGDWTKYLVHVYYSGTDSEPLCEFLRHLRDTEFPAHPVSPDEYSGEGEELWVEAESLDRFMSLAEDFGLTVDVD